MKRFFLVLFALSVTACASSVPPPSSVHPSQPTVRTQGPSCGIATSPGKCVQN